MSTPADQVFTSPTTPTGPATPSQFPQGGATTPADGSSGGGNWLSTIGNWASQNQNLLGGLATAGVGLYQSGQATQAGKAAAGQIQSTVQPGQNVSNATYGQLTGGPAVGGPMGASITGQTGAAAELTGVAQQYGTGQLTSAQQTQIQQQIAAQKAQVDQQLAASGNMNSSARDAAHQQIDNNAAILSQQLINQNIQMAEGAQTSVSNTYNSLLTNALNQAHLGLAGTSTAVQTQLQNDQQVQQALQTILAGITTGLTSASGGGSVAAQGGKAGGTTPAASPMAQAGQAIGSGIQSLFGGGAGSVDTSWMSSPSTQADVTASLGTVQPMDLSQLSDASSTDYTGYTGG